MRRHALYLLFILSLGIGLAPAADCAEELFDTKAAAQHTEKGLEFLSSGKYDAAIKEFEESVNIFPDAEAYYYLGYSYYMKGKKGDGPSRKKAAENFDKAYELNPNFSPTRISEEPREEPTQAEPAAPEEQPETGESEASRVFQGTAQPGAEAEQQPAETQQQQTRPQEQPQEPPAEQQEPPQEEQPQK